MDVTSDELFRYRWRSALLRNSEGAPLLGPHFVAQLGAEVAFVDLRPQEAAAGALGHVPGSLFISANEAPRDRAVVLVDADGDFAASEALRLDRAGHPLVAALAGGLVTWRRTGLATSRQVATASKTPPAATSPSIVEALRDQLSDPRVVRWIQLVAVARLGHLSCVDGRDERGVIGTPGGDAGELLLLLAALEELSGQALDDRAVSAILLARLDAFGALYLHTDLHAHSHLLEAVHAEPRLRDAFADVEEIESLVHRIRRPAAGIEDALLDLLVDPANVGCGHLRLIDQRPDEYGVRPGLATALQRAAWRLLWSGSPEILVTTLSGEHRESAVLDVSLDTPPWALSHLPLVPPQVADQQMFVNHSDAVDFLREANVQFLLRGELPVRIPLSRADELRATIKRLAARQLTATLGHLAAGLPVYEATFHADRSVDVRLASG